MKTIKTKVYEFDELQDTAKEKARDWYREGAFNHDWWEHIYEDAATAGLRLKSFDLDRNRPATGEFIAGALECAHKIVDNHGEDCETRKTAEAFLKERDGLVDAAPRDEDGEFESEHGLDEKLDACEAEFMKSILEDYSIILQKESEYMVSNEVVDENIKANEYTFTESGKRFG